MGLVKEYKDFISRGNVVDLAVAVVIGAAFGKIITSFVNDIIMPPIGMLLGGTDFKELKWVIQAAQGDAAEVVMSYGAFLNVIIEFIIIAFAIFMVVKGINNMKKKEEEAPAAPPAPSAEETLLSEIRDLLKKG